MAAAGKDMKEAIKWFRKSAEQGFVDAQAALGQCYRTGEVCIVFF